MELIEYKIEDIKPYPNNARKITEQGIQAVVKSIEEFGYQQPIVVDTEGVIVVGHTRYEALLRLGWKTVRVHVTNLPEKKVREYRLADNKIGELTQWDHSALVIELREFETELLDQFFPDVDLEVKQVEGSQVTQEQFEDAAEEIGKIRDANAEQTHTTKVECPSCYGTFKVRTRSLPGISHDDLKDLISADGRA